MYSKGGKEFTNEILQSQIPHVPIASITLDHKHLVGRAGVHVAIDDVRDISA